MWKVNQSTWHKDTSMRQRKSPSPRQQSNPWPPEYQARALYPLSLFQALGSWGRAKRSERKNEGGLRRGVASLPSSPESSLIFLSLSLFFTPNYREPGTDYIHWATRTHGGQGQLSSYMTFFLYHLIGPQWGLSVSWSLQNFTFSSLSPINKFLCSLKLLSKFPLYWQEISYLLHPLRLSLPLRPCLQGGRVTLLPG